MRPEMNWAGLLMVVVASLLVGACSAKPATATRPSSPPPVVQASGPACITEGCCAGHGTVAYIQPDRFIMCTDGQASQICDCHI